MKTTRLIDRLQAEVPEGFTVRRLNREMNGDSYRYGLWDAQGDLWCWWNSAREFEEALEAVTLTLMEDEIEMNGDL